MIYQVHVKNGINAQVHNFETLTEANGFIFIYAQENNLTYGIDRDGFQWACDKSDYPTLEAFIFSIA
jgi:hypothetical protein